MQADLEPLEVQLLLVFDAECFWTTRGRAPKLAPSSARTSAPCSGTRRAELPFPPLPRSGTHRASASGRGLLVGRQTRGDTTDPTLARGYSRASRRDASKGSHKLDPVVPFASMFELSSSRWRRTVGQRSIRWLRSASLRCLELVERARVVVAPLRQRRERRGRRVGRGAQARAGGRREPAAMEAGRVAEDERRLRADEGLDRRAGMRCSSSPSVG